MGLKLALHALPAPQEAPALGVKVRCAGAGTDAHASKGGSSRDVHVQNLQPKGPVLKSQSSGAGHMTRTSPGTAALTFEQTRSRRKG